MHKQIIKADVPENGGAYNLCVRYGDIALSFRGWRPSDATFCAEVAAARIAGTLRFRRCPTHRFPADFQEIIAGEYQENWSRQPAPTRIAC